MPFVALAVAFVPDLDAARRRGGLDGLDDRSVAKILFHQRRQASGTETLRWDQVATAAVTLVHHDPAHTEVARLSTVGTAEHAVLDQLSGRLAGNDHVVMWDPHGHDLAALRYRAACLDRSQPLLWRADAVTELARLYGGPVSDRPTLDDLAHGIGLPAASGRADIAPLDAWLSGDPQPMIATTQRAAINLYVLALRTFHVAGALGQDEMQAGLSRLRQWSDASADGVYPELPMALDGLR